MSDDKFSNHSCPECGAPEGLHDKNCSYGDNCMTKILHNKMCGGIIIYKNIDKWRGICTYMLMPMPAR